MMASVVLAGHWPEPRAAGVLLSSHARAADRRCGMHSITCKGGIRKVLDDTHGQKLEAAVQAINTEVGGMTYKSVPSGLPAEHPRADWLRHSGLFADFEQPLRRLQPLQQWLVELLPD